MLLIDAPTRAADDDPTEPLIESSRTPLIELSARTEAEHLTGDWGGWRTRLFERGLHFQAGYIGETFGNVSGGLHRAAVYEGLAEAAIEVDLERLTDAWRGATFRASALFPHGRSPSRDLVGDVQTLSNIDAYDSVALYELWLEQNLWDDHVSVRAGQLLADAEFAFTDLGAILLNSSFGWPAFISANTLNTGPAYFRAAPGVRLRLEPARGVYTQAAVFDGDTFDNAEGRESGNPHGINFQLNREQGAFVIGEIGWRWPAATNDSALPGVIKGGAWLHTAEFTDLLNPGRAHANNYGAYLAAEQVLWREALDSEQGLGAFARLGLAPDDRNFFSVAGDAGFHYRGLLPGRDQDAVAFGVAVASVGQDARKAARSAGASILPDHEIAVELAYHIQVRPWFRLVPDFQWIHHPGASGAIDDAIVLGLRTLVTF